MSDDVLALAEAQEALLDASDCRTPGEAPAELFNPPAQDELAYRIGTHGTFFRRMLGHLSRQALPAPAEGARAPRPLSGLTTRTVEDHTVALLDAFATVADVLTFYQERIANEGFLRTATERRSVLELAREIGYELGPGAAATALLAFEIDVAPGAPRRATIHEGLAVASVPGQGERPQTFETVEEIEARADWNALRARTRVPQVLEAGATSMLVEGVATALRPGDRLLFVGPDRLDDPRSDAWTTRTVRAVAPQPAAGFTHVSWDEELPELGGPAVHVLRRQATLFGAAAPDWRLLGEDARRALLGLPPRAPQVLVVSDRATEVRRDEEPERTAAAEGEAVPAEWPDFALPAGGPLDLDATYPEILEQSWVLAEGADTRRLYQVEAAAPAARVGFALTGTVTRLEISPADLRTREGAATFPRRETVVLCQSELLPLAERPDPSPVTGTRIDLAAPVADLPGGRTVIVSGELEPGAEATNDPRPEVASEPAAIDSVVGAPAPAIVLRGDGLTRRFRRETVVVQANVARATHGETIPAEVLGDGNGAAPNQRFDLKRPPLTHRSSPTSVRPVSTLEVRVNDVEWRQASSLYELSATDEAYLTRIEDDGRTTIVFGDGSRGARLPTGRENVVARYRSGIGPEGEVRAGQLSLLAAKPLGVRGVTNPLRASGAASPEHRDDARRNAPLTVVTLDRAVSLRDFEAIARAYPGVGKAQAVEVWDGHRRVAMVTIGTESGESPDAGSPLIADLRGAIRSVGDPVLPVEIRGFAQRSFRLRASVAVAPARTPAVVRDAVQAALDAVFAYRVREFGEPVTAAEIVRTMQGVAGVEAARIDVLELGPEPAGGPDPGGGGPAASPLAAPGTRDRVPPVTGVDRPATDAELTSFAWVLPARPARSEPAPGGGFVVLPAELLLPGPGDLAVALMTTDVEEKTT